MGGGGSRTHSNNFFSPQLISQSTDGVKWFYYRENYTYQRIQKGQHVPGGSKKFLGGGGGGTNANFYRNPYNFNP